MMYFDRLLSIGLRYWNVKIQNILSMRMTLCCKIYTESQIQLTGHLKLKIYCHLWDFMKYGLHRVLEMNDRLVHSSRARFYCI